jgi:hypothetical protein
MSTVLENPIIRGNVAPTSRAAVIAATLVPGTLASNFVHGSIIDGITLSAGDRILIKNQADTTQNGVYIVQTSGVPLRSQDMPIGNNVTCVNIAVQRGASQAGSEWAISNYPAVVGTDSLSWVQTNVNSTLTTARGGTGTSSLGGTNTLLYTSTTNTIGNIPTSNNGVLITSGAGVPSISSSLPADMTVPTPRLIEPTLNDASGNYQYNIVPATLSADCDLQLPAVTTSDEFTLNEAIQTLHNKSLDDSDTVFFHTVDPTKTLRFNCDPIPVSTQVILSSPTDSGTIATTQYVDSVVANMTIKMSCIARVSLPLTVVQTGSQDTKTLTNSVNGTIASSTALFDGVTLVLNDRVLVDNAAWGGSSTASGIYTVSSEGSAGTPWALLRASDANSSAEVFTGMTTYVVQGTSYANTQWVLNTTGTIVLDTTVLNFTQFGAATVVTAGDGLVQSGNILSVGGSDTIAVTTDTVFVKSYGVSGRPLVSAASVGNEAVFAALNLSNTNATTNSLPITRGGTGRTTAPTTNGILYGGASAFGATSALANAILITDASSVPALSTTAPNGLTMGNNWFVNDSDASQKYQFLPGDLTAGAAANSIINLPADGGTAINDTMTLNNLAQSLQNKTLVNPKIQGNIFDTSAAIVLGTTGVASAVNYLVSTNAVTSGNPSLSAAGTDTNINLLLQAKGTGGAILAATATAPASLTIREQTTVGTAGVKITAPPLTSSAGGYTLTLPNTVGSAGQVLSTLGSGALTWSTRYCICSVYSGQATASSSSYVDIAWFSWYNLSQFTAVSLIFSVYEYVDYTLDVQVYDITTPISIGKLTGISGVGIYELLLALPTTRCELVVQIRRSGAGAVDPKLRGIQFRLSG